MRFYTPLIPSATVLIVACLNTLFNPCPGKCEPSVPTGDIHSCAVSGAADGTQQGNCNGGLGNLCESGLACVDWVCIPCGGNADACCEDPGGADFCNSGGTCDHTADWPICRFDCGTPGQKCCPDNNCSVGACDIDTQQCVGDSSVCSGSTSFDVWVISNTCAGTKLEFRSDNSADADACVEQNLANDPDLTAQGDIVGEPDQEPNIYYSCAKNCPVLSGAEGAHQFTAFSSDEAVDCGNQTDGQCDWSPPSLSPVTCD
ncbi:MAG TPA: hypothetical protein VGG28_06820 [Kofleriaceae bacterium]|jgi:hypothetical protein